MYDPIIHNTCSKPHVLEGIFQTWNQLNEFCELPFPQLPQHTTRITSS